MIGRNNLDVETSLPPVPSLRVVPVVLCVSTPRFSSHSQRGRRGRKLVAWVVLGEEAGAYRTVLPVRSLIH